MMFDYPLVVDSGETFLNDKQFLGYVREKCGDIAAGFIAQRIDTDEMPPDNREFLKKLKNGLETLIQDVSDLEDNSEELLNLLDHELGVN